MIYKTHGTCSREIEFEVEDGKIVFVNFSGGCDGNAKGIASLVRGMDIDEVIERLSGITCGYRKTSCPDQFSKALLAYKAKLEAEARDGEAAGNPAVPVQVASSGKISSGLVIEHDELIACHSEEKEIVIPEGVVRIGEEAFAGNRTVTGIEIPATVKEIGKRAFAGCSNLLGFTGIDKVQVLGPEAFADCIGLTVLSLKNADDIGSHIICGCTSLRRIRLSRRAWQRSLRRYEESTRLPFEENLTGYPYSPDRDSYEEDLRDRELPALREIFIDDRFLDSISPEMQTTDLWAGAAVHRRIFGWRKDNRCSYCGGKLKGLKKAFCSECGRPRNYKWDKETGKLVLKRELH